MWKVTLKLIKCELILPFFSVSPLIHETDKNAFEREETSYHKPVVGIVGGFGTGANRK